MLYAVGAGDVCEYVEGVVRGFVWGGVCCARFGRVVILFICSVGVFSVRLFGGLCCWFSLALSVMGNGEMKL